MHNTLYCLVETTIEDWEDYSYSESDFYENAFVLANTDYVSNFDDPEKAIADEMYNLPPYVERTGKKTFCYVIKDLREMFLEKYHKFQEQARSLTASQFMQDTLELYGVKSCICNEIGDIVYCEGFGTMYIDDFHRRIISGEIKPELALAGILDYHI